MNSPKVTQAITSDQLGRQWVETWRKAAPELERVRRDELRRLDQQQAIALLSFDADYFTAPRIARQSSGLIQLQRWFMRAQKRESSPPSCG